MVSKVKSLGIFGMRTFTVEVETDVSGSKFRFDIVGLPDTAVSEARERVQAALEDMVLWRMTPLQGTGAGGGEDTHMLETAGLEVRSTVVGESLELELSGRLDTLTSPDLLEFLEQTAAKHKISKVLVDCAHLDYISSAGLRVLLIMSKNAEGGVTLASLTDDVRHIIEQSSFDTILDIVP
jgi:anti-anti-sigma factor